MRAPSSLLALAIVLGGVLAPLTARATDVQACLTASEKGQRARAGGKLREARDQFLVCGAEGCPALVRRDCTQWQGEIVNLLPSVVFGAKDAQGRDLFDVSVSMDGEVLGKQLDGKSIAVDPGPHTFRFESAGRAAIVERALVKEGEKTRVISVSFKDASDVRDMEKEHPESPTRHGHTVLPWVLVGVGAAAVVVGMVYAVTAPSLPASCNSTTTTCTRGTTETSAQFSQEQSDAGEHDQRPKVGLILGAVGLAAVAGGLIWHFLEPTGERTNALQVTPWVGVSGAGGALGGTF